MQDGSSRKTMGQRNGAPLIGRRAGIVALVATVACRQASAPSEEAHAPSAAATAASGHRIVAYIGSTPISQAQVEAKVAHTLYETRSAAMHELLSRRLIGEEARRRGVSPTELLRQEIDEKVTEPSEGELRAFFTTAQAEGHINPEQNLDSVKEDFLGARMRVMRSEREKAFAKELYARANVRINLDGLGRPARPDVERGPSRGPADAPIVVVEYTDFTSSHCRHAHSAVQELLKTYAGRIRVAFRQKPAKNDDLSFQAARAALCADAQEHYWDYRQALFSHQGDLSEEALLQHATAVGIRLPEFRQCLDATHTRERVQQDVREAREHGLEGTPVFSLNGTRLSGAHEFNTFKELIEMELAWNQRFPEPS